MFDPLVAESKDNAFFVSYRYFLKKL